MNAETMKNFQFPEVTEGHLVNVNFRRELHGDDHVHAVDLRVRREYSNEQLSLLDPRLREALYYNKAALPGQVALAEVLIPLPNLRFSALNGQKFGWLKGIRIPGFRFIVDYGLGPEQSNLDLPDCKVSSWVFETKEGGTAILWFTVQCAGNDVLDEKTRGKLSGMTDETIHFQLLQPPVLKLMKGKAKPAADDPNQGRLDSEEEPDDETTGGAELEEDGPAGETSTRDDWIDPLTPEGALAASVTGSAAP